MTTTAAGHDLQHAPSPTGGGVRRLLLGPGLLRGAWMFVLFGWIGFGIVVLIRWAADWQPILATEPLVLSPKSDSPAYPSAEPMPVG